MSLSWCNSASIRNDEADDAITLSLSTGDPRGELWKSVLFSDRCRACELRCHTCHTLASAIGYERAGGPAGLAAAPRKPGLRPHVTENPSPRAVTPI